MQARIRNLMQRHSEVWGVLHFGSDSLIHLHFRGRVGGPYSVRLARTTWDTAIFCVKRSVEGFKEIDAEEYLSAHPETLAELQKKFLMELLTSDDV